jgi:hypothetical protein
MTMFNTTKIALSVAIILGTVSGGFAATKHPSHNHRGTAAQRQAPAATAENTAFGSSAYGYATPFRIPQPNSGNGIGTNFLSSGEGTIAN